MATDDVILAFFGEVRPDKGLDILFHAVRTLRRVGLPVRLLMVTRLGTADFAPTSYQKRMLVAMHEGRRDGWLTWAQAPTTESAARLLRTCDIGVFPFTMGASENRGSLLAALVNQLPVLTTRGISTPDRFEEEYGVDCVQAGDAAALAARLATLVRDPDQRNRLVARALSAAANLSWDSIAERTIEVYRTVARGACSRRPTRDTTHATCAAP